MQTNINYEKLNQCILCGSDQLSTYDEELLLNECTYCGHIFDNPRPTLESIQKYYSRKGKYDSWLRVEKGLDKQWEEMYRRIIRFRTNGTLLDVGAGIGHFLSVARRSFSIYGTEISDEAVALAKKKYDISLYKGTLNDVPVEKVKYDIITFFHVMEHVQFPGETINYCKNLLKDDGILYIAVPNEASYSLRRLLPGLFSKLGFRKFKRFKANGFCKINLDDLEEIHLSHFSEKSLNVFLAQNGYKILDSGIDFLDPYRYVKGPVQIVRYVLFFIAHVIKRLVGINCYNSLWVAAQKIT